MAKSDRWWRPRVLFVENEAGCWVWQYTTHADGYGMWRGRPAHRVAYEATYGPIPAGLHIDHLCRTRACVRPDHLEAVTQAENNRRGKMLRTHCPQGHPYDQANTFISSKGWRFCRACRPRWYARAHA